MSEQPKPPLSVWLDRHAETAQTLGFYAPQKESLHVPDDETTFGPYVHLDQFMEIMGEKSLTVRWRFKGNQLI